MAEQARVCVIGCAVLGIDILQVAQRLGTEISCRFLESELHNEPAQLRLKLQEAIDEASQEEKFERIVVGYGICGRGTVGIEARQIPLVFPKVHDCIALFLGSDKAYKEEFGRYPGTYYISAGWYEEKAQPMSQKQCGAFMGDKFLTLEHLTEKYGAEHAKEIIEFLNHWQQNYQRAVFIDTGAGQKKKYAEYAQVMAKEFGWKYEQLEGNLGLLEKMLWVTENTDEILVVPLGYVTQFDPVAGGLTGVPVYQEGKKWTEKHDKITITNGNVPGKDAESERVKIGLGIDAGGTYTDAVIYDFAVDKVIAKSKALTTKWDFTEGIGEALSSLKENLLAQVELVSVSTTLATNAIVEGYGQKVGLLLMPPYGLFDPADVGYKPKAVIRGMLEIDGKELEPVDEEQVRDVVGRMVREEQVKAFAVSGFASTINPAHELTVKKIIRKETDCSVTCRHELSQLLNFRTRARTAVLNARIIPRLEKLLSELEQVLQARGISVPIMVVKGDGSLIAAQVARDKPVETILSGPAASVAGAKHLTGISAALVVDMGGTTTDTAALKDSAVRVCQSGTRVGGYKTHVKALEMRTVGLGGDSLIVWKEGMFSVGPRRVAPIAWLGSKTSDITATLDYLQRRLDDYRSSTAAMQIVILTGHTEEMIFTAEEQAIIELLRERPYSLDELAEKTQIGYWNMPRLSRLQEHSVVQYCGLTPTDLLHVKGDFQRWDSSAARRMCEMVSSIAVLEPDELVEHLLEEVTRKLAVELMKKQLDEETEADKLDDCAVCQVLFKNMLGGGKADYRVKMELLRPVIGIGAPVHYFLPRAAKLLGSEFIVPQDADVANAVGAISSNIVVQRQVRIKPNDEGGFVIEGLAGAKNFDKLEQAHTWAAGELEKQVRQQGQVAGTRGAKLEIAVDDTISSTANGRELFMGRTLSAQLVGQPSKIRTTNISSKLRTSNE
ncbi:MAG: DUF1638 domain-containing protein [Sedimentisphaerales bacterium]|nr:DUF1638 domain-containing protein [Sedimentisphaerales bacterium]